MIITNKTYTIALDEKEVENLVSALEEVALFRAELCKNNSQAKNYRELREKYDVAYDLRKAFGAIIGKHYMGSDL